MRSKLFLFFGLILIAVGGVALSYGGIPYKSRDVVIDVGPLSATAESNRTWAMAPAVSVLTLIAGVVLIAVSVRKT